MIVITPVKDSLSTTKQTIEHISQSDGNFDYYVFNDFSGEETTVYLEENQEKFAYKHVNLAAKLKTPSPNYISVLRMAQKMALEEKTHLIIIESDVLVERNTIDALGELADSLENAGMIGAVTTEKDGTINFPYKHITKADGGLFVTQRSLSFCCTLVTYAYLKAFDFKTLNPEKDWFDVSISKMSRKLGFDNYLSNKLSVVHMPHSSRPWKNEKYSNPLSYYFKKFFFGRDKI